MPPAGGRARLFFLIPIAAVFLTLLFVFVGRTFLFLADDPTRVDDNFRVSLAVQLGVPTVTTVPQDGINTPEASAQSFRERQHFFRASEPGALDSPVPDWHRWLPWDRLVFGSLCTDVVRLSDAVSEYVDRMVREGGGIPISSHTRRPTQIRQHYNYHNSNNCRSFMAGGSAG